MPAAIRYNTPPIFIFEIGCAEFLHLLSNVPHKIILRLALLWQWVSLVVGVCHAAITMRNRQEQKEVSLLLSSPAHILEC